MQPAPEGAVRPVAIRSPEGGRQTVIEWSDGHRSLLPHDILRGYCPCAGCQGHSGALSYRTSTDAQQELSAIEPVGNYALRLEWFDGHGSGLYSFRYLRALCQCAACASASPDKPDLPRM